MAQVFLGVLIENKALVYFDFNPAVETPEVVNTIGDPSAVKSQDLTLEILLLKQRINALDITNKQGFIAKLDAAYNKLQTAIENIQANKKELAEKNIETSINELEALIFYHWYYIFLF
ncbi:MAG: hypothetical protein M1326_09650 [Cyanobacteria bacterium]|nr:hypothetical protein [Cyanobacteriota bacterium]